MNTATVPRVMYSKSAALACGSPSAARRSKAIDDDGMAAEFQADPATVFTQIVKEEGKSIQTLQLKRRVIDLGLPAEQVNAAFVKVKPILAKNRHLVVQGCQALLERRTR
jgi:hypothetical protein